MPRPTLARTVRRTAASLAVTMAAAAAAVSLSGAPAVADIRHDIATARAQLDRLNAQQEAVAERLDAVRSQLAAAQNRADSASAASARATQRLDSARRSVTAFAVEAYMNGNVDSITSVVGQDNDPTTFLDKMATLQAISRSQQLALAGLAAAQHDQSQAQAATTAALAAQQKLFRDAQAAKATILAQAGQAQALLTRLEQKQQQLIRAARAAAARRAAEAEAARLARERALAAQAARALTVQNVTATPTLPPAGSGGADAARTAVRVALAQLGKPYVWAAAGPDTFDCSGLTMYAYAAAGIGLTHYTGAQWNEGRHVTESQLQPGDLVFFNTDGPLGHEGMYIGNGQFVHAPHTGDVVKVSALSGYYQQTYAGAVRVTG